jgi:hypothetical protein
VLTNHGLGDSVLALSKPRRKQKPGEKVLKRLNLRNDCPVPAGAMPAHVVRRRMTRYSPASFRGKELPQICSGYPCRHGFRRDDSGIGADSELPRRDSEKRQDKDSSRRTVGASVSVRLNGPGKLFLWQNGVSLAKVSYQIFLSPRSFAGRLSPNLLDCSPATRCESMGLADFGSIDPWRTIGSGWGAQRVPKTLAVKKSKRFSQRRGQSEIRQNDERWSWNGLASEFFLRSNAPWGF